MAKHIETFLTSVGLPAEDAATFSSLSESEQETFDVKPFVDKVKSNYQTQLQNDPAFFNDLTIEKLPPDIKKKLESAQYARMTNVGKEKFIKSLGLSTEETKDLMESDEYKALDFFIPAITERWMKTKSGDKETQQQLIEARKQLEKYGPDFEKEIETKHEKLANEKINSALFRASLIGELSAIPGLKIPAADIAKAAEDILTGKYSFERVGDFSIELRQKANPQMKVLKDNSSHELTLKEALQTIAAERNWIDAEEKNQQGSGKIKVETGKDGNLHMVPPHLRDKISKKIATEK